ncbi:Uncharacterised protein [Vibrio cholerae]|uniref:Uncharacterized protein n=1 Tax=Vibrio cholerae TaxID=666 RepID=A0A656AN85_VIBCL|nr:Uncharacterised protein [Vibrio cholerae]CSI57419.1 Uncharacterised protein [Vibrio cholerae]
MIWSALTCGSQALTRSCCEGAGIVKLAMLSGIISAAIAPCAEVCTM